MQSSLVCFLQPSRYFFYDLALTSRLALPIAHSSSSSPTSGGNKFTSNLHEDSVTVKKIARQRSQRLVCAGLCGEEQQHQQRLTNSKSSASLSSCKLSIVGDAAAVRYR